MLRFILARSEQCAPDASKRIHRTLDQLVPALEQLVYLEGWELEAVEVREPITLPGPGEVVPK